MHKQALVLLGALATARGLIPYVEDIADEDSCPAPPKTFAADSILGPVNACSFCGTTLERGYATADAPWQDVSFENQTPEDVSLVELTPAGTEYAHGAIKAGERQTIKCQMGTVWRAKDKHGIVLVEHLVGRVRLVAEPAAMTLLDDRDARRFALEKAKAIAPIYSDPDAPTPPGEYEFHFPRTFVNHCGRRLDLYFYDEGPSTETLIASIDPFTDHTVATYWEHAWVVRDPATGLRAAQFKVPVIAIKACAERERERADRLRLPEPIGLRVVSPENDTVVPGGTGSWLLGALSFGKASS